MMDKAIRLAIARLLAPLVRLLLRHGVPYGTFDEVARRVYVDVALKEFQIPGRTQTNSRAAVITGLSRKEILRITRLPPLEQDEAARTYNRAVRVIGGWVRDAEFQGQDGAPAKLPFEGDAKSFSQLVRRYSGDVTPRAILDELARVGSVESLENGEIRLMSRAYVPVAGDTEKISILGSDVADLVTTIDYNMQAAPKKSRLQLKVMYDNVPAEPLAKFRAMSTRESRKMLELLDRELSAVDRDASPDAKGTGRFRAGVSIYYFEEDLSESDGEE